MVGGGPVLGGGGGEASRQLALERRADDHHDRRGHGSERGRRRHRRRLGVSDDPGQVVGGCLRPRPVVDPGLLVGERRRRRDRGGGLVAPHLQVGRGLAGRAGAAVAVEYGHLHRGGGDGGRPRRLRGLAASSRDGARMPQLLRMLPLVHRLVDRLRRRCDIGVGRVPRSRRVELDGDHPALDPVGEGEVADHRLHPGDARMAGDLDVGGDRLHHIAQRGQLVEPQPVELARRGLLERAQEHLLAGVAVEVRVGVAVARERQRVDAAQELVARRDVDLRVLLGARRVHVVVVLVDHHVDAADLVHELDEAPEVDGHQIVGVDAGQR